MHRWLIAIIVIAALSPRSPSQQLDCTLQADYTSLGTAQYDLLTDFADDVRGYINNNAWGEENFPEKVRCALNIFVKGTPAENRYSAQVFIGSQRTIYNTDQSSAVVRLFDEDWEFTYIKNRPLNRSPHSFNDLTSFLDFYSYVALGYDYDTYEPGGGTPWFQKAADVANLGRASGAKGWELKTSSYSRVQLMDEILSPKFAQARTAVYRYHFSGLDSLSINRSHALANILKALETIGKLRKEVNPRNIYIKSFFEAKYLEIAQLFVDYPDPNIYKKLAIIDPAHQTAYEEYNSKRK